ncbi:MAG: hypothetical protein FJ267_17495, partial [Planctomycetes bacterium]|nr:hypothetical protein [Planctomycetota bacterium]
MNVRNELPRVPEWNHETGELLLWIENTRTVWCRVEQIFRAAQRYYDKGRGDRKRLERGLERVAAIGAQDYHRENGTPGDRWHELFPVASRRLVAT